MGEKFKNFVESFGECRYVPVGSCCSICGKKLSFLFTGFWSVNNERYNRLLFDGVLCDKCQAKAEQYIKSKKKWLNKEELSLEKWQKFSSNALSLYSVEDISMLMEQKEISDKEALLAYGADATGLFSVRDSFGLNINVFAVGIFRYNKIKDKSVVYGISEEGMFQKGDRVKVDIGSDIIETTVLEAYRLDKDCINGRKLDDVFFESLKANVHWDRKVKENQEGWLVLDIVWKYKLNGGRVIKIS